MENSSIQELVKILGIEKYKLKGHELACLCLNPLHDDQNLGNFYINLKHGYYNCFSCHYKGNIINLLYNYSKSYTKSIAIWNTLILGKNEEYSQPLRPLDRYQLLPYLDNPISQYAIDRVGDINVLEEYKVRSDDDGNPIFFSQRRNGEFDSIWTKVGGRYYLLQPEDAKKHGVLFGEHLPPTDYHVLVEGMFDALAVRKYLGYKSICGFGTQLTNAQYDKLRRMDNLVIFMDGDTAGRNAREKIVTKLNSKSDLFVMGGYRKDPDELGEEMIPLFVNKKHIMEFRMGK